ncbi:hypothetical protein LINPERHAP1_LOCUS25227, partial [Linum perenne]
KEIEKRTSSLTLSVVPLSPTPRREDRKPLDLECSPPTSSVHVPTSDLPVLTRNHNAPASQLVVDDDSTDRVPVHHRVKLRLGWRSATNMEAGLDEATKS